MSRYKPRGWRNEPHRHALAAKGISTNNKYFQSKQSKASQIFSRGSFVEAEKSKRRSLLTPTRVKEEQQRAQVAAQPVLSGPLTREEAAEVEQTKQDLGVRGITDNTAWRFWQPRDTVKVINELVDRKNEIDEEISTAQSVKNNQNNSQEVREQAEERVEKLMRDLDEINRNLTKFNEVLYRVQQGDRPADFDKRIRDVLSKHAIRSGRLPEAVAR